ncbi:heterokaryon incompatibility protein-domain-containing protein [Podospora aff. communis PSN243]|uniref:Heterokaryon incompatibility protein-domain-containing protein n=1 Tax=Podospora aff. communis PSN243 TaxID=3040156 RepID=A0AAV9G418_9PEZI|nr:heterokaryon incompatibility protein-domain-containing protein [Podospora aff. communis PSN243]
MAQWLEYKPLPVDAPSIRLLFIEQTPSPSDGTIVCTTETVPLRLLGQTPYRALSYAWRDKVYLTDDGGSTHQKESLRHIICDGQDAWIPPTLYHALWRMRQRLEVPRVWVDYLCINQADSDEKTSQVALMGSIFALAEEVIVWLGESSPSLNGLNFEWTGDTRDDTFIERYIRCFNKWEVSAPSTFSFDALAIPTNRIPGRPESPLVIFVDGRPVVIKDGKSRAPEASIDSQSFVLEDQLARPAAASGVLGVFCLLSMLHQDHTSPVRFHGGDMSFLLPGQIAWSKQIDEMLWLLTERPWWKRTWVVQECVLARKAVVYCGGMSASWDMIAGGARAYLRNMTQRDLLRSSERNPLLVLSQMILQIEFPRSLINLGSRMRFLDVLRQFHSRNATDPRDKVYGLLGLVQTGPKFTITPNYKLTAHTVFVQTALQVLSDERGLKLLLGDRSSRQPSFRQESTLPTWCVDWGMAPATTEKLRLQCLELYAADGKRPATPLHLHDNPLSPLLELNAFIVDEVDSVEAVVLPEEGFNRWQAAARNFVRKVLQGRYSLREFDVCRHICGDIVHAGGGLSPDESQSYRRAHEGDEAAFDFFLRDDTKKANRKTSTGPGQMLRHSYVPPPAVTAGRNSVYHAMQSLSSNRRVFYPTMGRGNIGIGPPGVQPGDQICIIPGLPVPLVIRPHTAQSCRESPTSRLSGAGPRTNPAKCNTRHEQCYSLVGDAYVPHIMDGRAIKSLSKEATIYLV